MNYKNKIKVLNALSGVTIFISVVMVIFLLVQALGLLATRLKHDEARFDLDKAKVIDAATDDGKLSYDILTSYIETRNESVELLNNLDK